MNMVVLIGGAQMFYRNFGLRHVGGVISYFAMELAGPNAGRKIVSLFARPNEWLRLRPRPRVPRESMNPHTQRPLRGLRGGSLKRKIGKNDPGKTPQRQKDRQAHDRSCFEVVRIPPDDARSN